MTRIENTRIAILATHGFEQSELFQPLLHLRVSGATVVVVSPETGKIRGWNDNEWGKTVDVDMAVEDARVEDFDALILPGGQMNPDTLRGNSAAVDFVRKFFYSGKPLAAICHGPWMLIEAGVIAGRRVTSYASIKTDVMNAGGLWQDSAVVTDQGLVTSRKPDDRMRFVRRLSRKSPKADTTAPPLESYMPNFQCDGRWLRCRLTFMVRK